MSTLQDVEFHLGEDWVIDFVATNINGDPIDINGSTQRFRLASLSGTEVMTRTESDGFAILNGEDGENRLTVTPTHQTNAGVVEGSVYQWEYKLTTSGNAISVQARGSLNVLPSLFA